MAHFRPGFLFALIALLLLVPAWCSGSVKLYAPEIRILENDREVYLEWNDTKPDSMVTIEQPVLGTLLVPWRGNASLEAEGIYVGACDWTFTFRVDRSGDSLKLLWSEVANWETKATRDRDLVISELDSLYTLSHGIKVRIKSDGLFEPDTSGWHGPMPEFGGIYRPELDSDPTVPIYFVFTCTDGGELGSESVAFDWIDDHGNSGDFTVDDADSWVAVSRGFKVRFAPGEYYSGESFGVDVLIPLMLGDQFRISAETFDGYLVLRHSVEDRETPEGGIAQYKVVANISKCDTFKFFLNESGEYDPYGTRHFTDKGVKFEAEGVEPSSDFATVLNGFPYYYTVVTYDWTEDYQLAMSDTNWHRVVPSVPPAPNAEHVYVVPNPYVGRAGWEVGEAKIQFVNIPKFAKIRIYDAAGSYINTVYPNHYSYDPTKPQGTADWNLKDSDGEDVVSGVYIYRVESNSGTKIGRFIVIR